MARSKTLRSLCGPSVLAPVLSVQRRNVVDGLVLQIEMVSSLNYLYYGANAGSSLILTQGLKHAPFSNSFYLQITRNANWLATWRPGPASTGVPGLCSVPHSQPPPLRPCGLYVLLRPRLGREGTRLALGPGQGAKTAGTAPACVASRVSAPSTRLATPRAGGTGAGVWRAVRPLRARPRLRGTAPWRGPKALGRVPW